MQSNPQLSSTLAVLSAMVTPAVLILASSSLVLATSNRLTRAVDRARTLTERVVDLADHPDEHTMVNEERELRMHQLERTARRAKLLTRAMTRLYTALAIFIATSVTLGVVAGLSLAYAWIALVLGLTGAGLLFWASLMLIVESRISLASVYEEMEFVQRMGAHYGPSPAPGNLVDPGPRRWRR